MGLVETLRPKLRLAAMGVSTVGMYGGWYSADAWARRSSGKPDDTATNHEKRLQHARSLFCRRWADMQLRLFRTTMLGDTRAQSFDRPTIIVANHRSALDILVLCSLFSPYFVARADMRTWPVVGPGLNRFGAIFVDRSDPKSGLHAVRAMVETLKANRVVALFPEGTTFDGDLVRPLRPGALLAAKHTNAQIIPVGLAYDPSSNASYTSPTFGAHLKQLLQTSAIRLAIRVGTPMAVKKSVSGDALLDLTRETLQGLVFEARATFLDKARTSDDR
jgi:lyso-ornithine lipid O-acyltransferase